MKTIILFISYFVFLHNILLSQNINLQCDEDDFINEININHLYGKIFVDKYHREDIQFFNPWLLGEVHLTNGLIATDQYLRYNGLLDELLWLRKLDYQTAIIERKSVSKFILYNKNGSKYAEFRRIDVSELNWEFKNDVYMQVLAEGYLSLYVYRKIGIINNSNELYLDHVFYIEKDKRLLKISRSGRWNLYKLLPEYKKEIRSIIRRYHYQTKKESPLIQLFKQLNEVKN